MVELMRWAVGALAVASLLAVVGYLVAFLVVVGITLARRGEPDPLQAELDAFLDGLLNHPSNGAEGAISSENVASSKDRSQNKRRRVAAFRDAHHLRR